MKKTCEFCDGTGQISFFKGVSRFLLSNDDCPECAGLGFTINEEIDEHKKSLKKPKISKSKNKKNT